MPGNRAQGLFWPGVLTGMGIAGTLDEVVLHQLLAWHVLSRGTRSSTSISLPDVFVPACLTPGTTALLVVHNHPSGDPTPSPDDARLTLRLAQAADILDMPLLDHLIVGDAGRYFSFREAGTLTAHIADGVRA